MTVITFFFYFIKNKYKQSYSISNELKNGNHT